jgi:hypothetical protein
MVSLCRKFTFLFSQTWQEGFLHQENKLFFSFINLFYFMNRRAVILLDWGIFPCNLVILTGLIQEYMFKDKRNCEPIDLNRFVVDLRERHYGVLDPDGCPREHNSKILTYNRWCARHPKKALATRSPYSLLKYMFLDLPQYVLQCCPFQTACPHPSLWDRNMEPQLLPYLWFVWSWWWCPGWTACYFPLHTPPYSSVSSQEIWQRGLSGQKPKHAPFCMQVQLLITRHIIKLDPT